MRILNDSAGKQIISYNNPNNIPDNPDNPNNPYNQAREMDRDIDINIDNTSPLYNNNNNNNHHDHHEKENIHRPYPYEPSLEPSLSGSSSSSSSQITPMVPPRVSHSPTQPNPLTGPALMFSRSLERHQSFPFPYMKNLRPLPIWNQMVIYIYIYIS